MKSRVAGLRSRQELIDCEGKLISIIPALCAGIYIRQHVCNARNVFIADLEIPHNLLPFLKKTHTEDFVVCFILLRVRPLPCVLCSGRCVFMNCL